MLSYVVLQQNQMELPSDTNINYGPGDWYVLSNLPVLLVTYYKGKLLVIHFF